MTSRQTFLAQLRHGLRGLPQPAINDILTDYTAHFSEGHAAGRSEDTIAAALGDPTRLARELRAEAGLRRWETDRSPAAAFGAIVAVLGLATLDLFILLPLLIVLGALLFTFITVGAVLFAAGLVVFGAATLHLLPGFTGTWLQGVLIGVALPCAAAALVAFNLLFAAALMNLLVRYGRVHYRLVNPVKWQEPARP